MGGPSGCTYSNNTATNDSSTDPLFISTSTPDFHISSGSPAIDAGTTISSASTDFDGTSRAQGTTYDIGAYEFISGLKGWWRFVNNPNDSSGNANNGTLQNSPSYGTGVTGGATSRNGRNQYV